MNSWHPSIDIEIIDIGSNETTCDDLPNFPFPNWSAMGGLDNNANPFICGKYEVTSAFLL